MRARLEDPRHVARFTQQRRHALTDESRFEPIVNALRLQCLRHARYNSVRNARFIESFVFYTGLSSISARIDVSLRSQTKAVALQTPLHNRKLRDSARGI